MNRPRYGVGTENNAIFDDTAVTSFSSMTIDEMKKRRKEIQKRIKARKQQPYEILKRNPSEWSLDDCNGVLHDYQWPAIENMSREDMIKSTKRLRERAKAEANKSSPFYSMTDSTMINVIDQYLKRRQHSKKFAIKV